MNSLLKAKYIIFAVVFVVFLLVGTKYGWLVQRYTFSQAMVRHPIGSDPGLKNDLNRCIRTCDEKDQESASAALAILNQVDEANKNLPEKIVELRPILQQAIHKYEQAGEVKNAAEVYKSALGLEEREDLKSASDPQFAELVYRGIEVLAGKFPRNGHAYEILGMARMQRNPRDESAIAAFKKCLTILPTEGTCRAGYDKAVRAYAAPYCQGAGLSSQVQIKSENGEPVINAGDVAELHVSSQDSEKESVLFTLTSEGHKKLQEKFPSLNAGALNLFFGEENLGTVETVRDNPASTALRANRPGLFARLCPDPKSNVLPTGLKL
jgi:tetratricopeptide (TPR) repeat protein